MADMDPIEIADSDCAWRVGIEARKGAIDFWAVFHTREFTILDSLAQEYLLWPLQILRFVASWC
jgi:hypothetical protein